MGCSASAPGTTVTNALCDKERDFFDAYSLGPKLWQGSSAQVRIAVGKEPSGAFREVAVKIIAKSLTSHRTSHLSVVDCEINLWTSIPLHQNIVQMYDMFYTNDIYFMVMEKCGSSLHNHLKTMDTLNEATLGKLIQQMLIGIAHLHDSNITHRNIKPDSYLIAQDGQTVKLCDFGFSIELPKNGLLNGYAGSAPFMCPEMLTRRGYNEKADIWSLGVLAYTVFFGSFPYIPEKRSWNSKAMHAEIVKGTCPDFKPQGVDSERRTIIGVAFVKKCLNRVCAQRPSAKEALHMPYMVMSNSGRMCELGLPSLRPMLRTAKQQGAFNDNLYKQSQVDNVLDVLQQQKYGSPIHVHSSELLHDLDSMKKCF